VSRDAFPGSLLSHRRRVTHKGSIIIRDGYPNEFSVKNAIGCVRFTLRVVEPIDSLSTIYFYLRVRRFLGFHTDFGVLSSERVVIGARVRTQTRTRLTSLTLKCSHLNMLRSV
jgi:hypothetical protein